MSSDQEESVLSQASQTPRGSFERAAALPVSRRRLLAASGGAAAFGVFLAACGDEEDEQATQTTAPDEEMAAEFGEGDLGIVNYALTLEYLEADFYDQAAQSGLFNGDQLQLIRIFGANEQTHVEALEETANQLGNAIAKPEAEFPLEDAEQVLELAATVENLGAAAYLGQAAAIESEDVLAAALSIHTVEARHAAALNKLLGRPITPDGPFAEPASMQEVLAEVEPFLVS